VTLRACVHLKDGKLVFLCVFLEKVKTGAEIRTLILFTTVGKKKRISWPLFQHRFCKWLNFEWS